MSRDTVFPNQHLQFEALEALKDANRFPKIYFKYETIIMEGTAASDATDIILIRRINVVTQYYVFTSQTRQVR